MSAELIITIVLSVFIFCFKSFHDCLHRKKINNELHKKIDSIMNIIEYAQNNIITTEENKIITNALTLEEKLLNTDEE